MQYNLNNYSNTDIKNHIKQNIILMERLDKTDIEILRVIQENSRLTNKEIASKVNLSSTPVFERIKRLESEGYIKKYMAVLDADKLNQGFIVYCNVKLLKLNRDLAKEFINQIMEVKEVTECYNVSGAFDYMLKIHAPNMGYYREFIMNVIGAMPNVGSIESIFVMEEVKHTFSIPLPD